MSPGNPQKNPLRSVAAPRVSAVVPVRNGHDEIAACLGALRDSDWPLHEILVVDDGSTDDTAEIARQMGAQVLRLDENHGPAFARNRGAEVAEGEILFFTDADVTVHRETVGEAVHCLMGDAEVSAVIGSYDEAPASPGFVAQYKNLFHHWVHQHARAEASTFWTGCGAVRREAFLAIGGFHEGYRKPSIEDIEFGFRLRAEGHRIRLEKRMLATHSKRWRLLNLVKTDVFLRGVPWIALMLRDRRAPEDLNLSKASKVATVFAGLCALALLAAPIFGGPAALLPSLALLLATWISARFLSAQQGRCRAALALGLTVLLPTAAALTFPGFWGLLPLVLWLLTAGTHPDLYAFFASHRGIAFAVGTAPLHLIFQWCCAASVPLGILTHFRDVRAARRGANAPAIAHLQPLTCRRPLQRQRASASAGGLHA